MRSSFHTHIDESDHMAVGLVASANYPVVVEFNERDAAGMVPSRLYIGAHKALKLAEDIRRAAQSAIDQGRVPSPPQAPRLVAGGN